MQGKIIAYDKTKKSGLVEVGNTKLPFRGEQCKGYVSRTGPTDEADPSVGAIVWVDLDAKKDGKKIEKVYFPHHTGTLLNRYEMAFSKYSRACADLKDALAEAKKEGDEWVEQISKSNEPESRKVLLSKLYRGGLSLPELWTLPRLWPKDTSDFERKRIGALRRLAEIYDDVKKYKKQSKPPLPIDICLQLDRLTEKDIDCFTFALLYHQPSQRKIETAIDFIRFAHDQLFSWTTYTWTPHARGPKRIQPMRKPLAQKDQWRRVIMSGHGIYHPEVPLIRVPKGLTIYFYVEEGTGLNDELGGKVDGLLEDGGALFPPTEVCTEGALVENYFLGFAGRLNIQLQMEQIRTELVCVKDPNVFVPLSTLLEDSRCKRAKEIHWSACRKEMRTDTTTMSLRRRTIKGRDGRQKTIFSLKAKAGATALDEPAKIKDADGKMIAIATLRDKIVGMQPGEVRRMARRLDPELYHKLSFDDGRVLAWYLNTGSDKQPVLREIKNPGQVKSKGKVVQGPYDTTKSTPGHAVPQNLTCAGLYSWRSGVFYYHPELDAKILAGKDIRCAGLVGADKGKIIAIGNGAGPCFYNWRGLWEAVSRLRELNVLADNAVVALLPAKNAKNRVPFSVKDYIELGQLGFPFDETLQRIEAYRKARQGELEKNRARCKELDIHSGVVPAGTEIHFKTLLKQPKPKKSGDPIPPYDWSSVIEEFCKSMYSGPKSNITAMLVPVLRKFKKDWCPQTKPWRKESYRITRRSTALRAVDAAVLAYDAACEALLHDCAGDLGIRTTFGRRFMTTLNERAASALNALGTVRQQIAAWQQSRGAKRDTTRWKACQKLGERLLDHEAHLTNLKMQSSAMTAAG